MRRARTVIATAGALAPLAAAAGLALCAVLWVNAWEPTPRRASVRVWS